MYDSDPDGVGFYSWRAAEEMLREYARLRADTQNDVGNEMTSRLAQRLRETHRHAWDGTLIIEAFPRDQLPRVETYTQLRERFGRSHGEGRQ